MSYRKDALNGSLNTVSVAPRALYTAWNTILDTGRTGLYNALNFGTRLGDRAKDIKTAVQNATNTGSNRKKLRRTPAALITGTGSFLTGLLRNTVATGRDLVGDLFLTFGNTFNNAGTAIKRMGKKEKVRDFKFEKLELSDPKMPSILPNWFKAA